MLLYFLLVILFSFVHAEMNIIQSDDTLNFTLPNATKFNLEIYGFFDYPNVRNLTFSMPQDTTS